MGMNVTSKWYAEAQRYNDTINPQNNHQFDEKDWARYNKNHERYGKEWNQAGKDFERSIRRNQDGDYYHRDKDWSSYDKRLAPPPATMAPADSESKLSPQAQEYLAKLRKSFADSNMEFVVAESTDSAEAKSKLSNTGKEFTILLTNEEIEHLAWDVKYRSDTMQKIRDMRNKLYDSQDKDRAKAKGFAGDEVMRVSLTGDTYGAIKKDFRIDKMGSAPIQHKAENRPVRTEPRVSKSRTHMRKARNIGRKH